MTEGKLSASKAEPPTTNDLNSIIHEDNGGASIKNEKATTLEISWDNLKSSQNRESDLSKLMRQDLSQKAEEEGELPKEPKNEWLMDNSADIESGFRSGSDPEDKMGALNEGTVDSAYFSSDS